MLPRAFKLPGLSPAVSQVIGHYLLIFGVAFAAQVVAAGTGVSSISTLLALLSSGAAAGLVAVAHVILGLVPSTSSAPNALGISLKVKTAAYQVLVSLIATFLGIFGTALVTGLVGVTSLPSIVDVIAAAIAAGVAGAVQYLTNLIPRTEGGMMSRYKLGRLPALRPAALSDLSVYTLGKCPEPPASVDIPDASFPMDGNDTVGDCTMAGVAHLIAAWNAEVHESDPVPDSAAVVKEYFTLTGGQDTGLNEADVLCEWHKSGLFGEQIAGYAPVNPKDTLQLHQSVAFYGGCYLGIACPESAQEQFQQSKPWTYVPGSPIEGGHCIVALGYTQTSLLCATWGGIAEVTAGFLAHFLEESWVILPHQLVEAKGDALGIDLATLQKDLAKV